MLNKIYNALISDSVISEKIVDDGIKFYEYPETGMTGTRIIIEPLDTPTPSDFADNIWLTEDYLYQIEVWSKNRTDRDIVAKQIQKIMWNELGFVNLGGIDERDKDLNIYRDARRYRGREYVDGL
ncbi:hypothetical protein ACDI16_02500 [Oceanobacillus caeni]